MLQWNWLQEYWPDLVLFMTSGPSVVLVITRPEGTAEKVIDDVRLLIGPANVDEAKKVSPNSLRSKFGSDKFVNAVHATDSKDSAARYKHLSKPFIRCLVYVGILSFAVINDVKRKIV